MGTTKPDTKRVCCGLEREGRQEKGEGIERIESMQAREGRT